METAYKNGVTMLQPDEACYRYLIQTASRRPALPHLGPMVDAALKTIRANYMVPDTDCFSAAIRTWKNAAVHQPDVLRPIREVSVRRAVELLAEMQVSDQQSTTVSVHVSTENINDVLEALTASRNPKRIEQAESFLSKMEEALTSDDETSKRITPNAESYIQVLRIWSTYPSIEKVAKAKLILLRMQVNFTAISSAEMSTTVLVEVLNEYIRVCGSYRAPSDKEGMQVLREALSAIEMLRRLGSLRPNAATFSALLDACGNLLSVGKERQLVVERIFTLCCDDGMVNGDVLRHLRNVATTEQFTSLVIDSSTITEGVKVVPREWTKNASRGPQAVAVDGRKTAVELTVDGTPAITASASERRMRRLRDKRNRNLLQGGRLPKPERRAPWRLHDPSQLSEQL